MFIIFYNIVPNSKIEAVNLMIVSLVILLFGHHYIKTNNTAKSKSCQLSTKIKVVLDKIVINLKI